jgi:hypothetical protein
MISRNANASIPWFSYKNGCQEPSRKIYTLVLYAQHAGYTVCRCSDRWWLYLPSWMLVYPLAHIVHVPLKNYELFALAAEFLDLRIHANMACASVELLATWADATYFIS